MAGSSISRSLQECVVECILLTCPNHTSVFARLQATILLLSSRLSGVTLKDSPLVEQMRLAQSARDGAAMMAHLSAENMRHLVSSTNAVRNLPFGLKDLINSDLLFGHDRGAIRGTTVRKKPENVRPVLINIPPQLYEKLKDVELTADVMFVNGSPFFCDSI